jgi:hypothetical protein
MATDLAHLTDPWQPAVLQLIAITAAGRRAGKPVGVCGEAAATRCWPACWSAWASPRCRWRRPPSAGRRPAGFAGKLQLRQGRLERGCPTPPTEMRRHRDQDRRRHVHLAGSRRRPGRRLGRGVRGHRRQRCSCRHPRRGDPDPAAHLPQPDPVDPADLSAIVALFATGVVYLLAKYADLTVNGQSQASSASSSSAPAPTTRCCSSRATARSSAARGPARGDGLRAAPRRPAIIASAATVVLGMLCLTVRRDELHRGPRPGRSPSASR